MNWQDILNSNLVSVLISSILALISVLFSVLWSTGKAQRGMDQALKVYESKLSQKVYASSKKVDMEYQIFHKLSDCCSKILQSMQQLYPDNLSTLTIQHANKSDLNNLALQIKNFEREINFSRAFVSSDIIAIYESLLENAELFFSDALKHNACWDETKADRARKADLKDIAYTARKSFECKWKASGTKIRAYLQTHEEEIP